MSFETRHLEKSFLLSVKLASTPEDLLDIISRLEGQMEPEDVALVEKKYTEIIARRETE